MCLCTLCADRFLQCVYPTEVFRTYCRGRQIGLPPTLPGRSWGETIRWWVETVRGCAEESRARLEWEQLAVSELGTPEGCDHLLAVAGRRGLPSARVPSGAPLALWFLLHYPPLFREVYRRHESREADVWFAARVAPGLPLPEPEAVEAPLAANLGAFFRESTGADGACAAVAHQIPGAVYLSFRVAGRPTAIATFSASGALVRRHLTPAVGADFVYYARDGTVLLRSPFRSPDRVCDLLDCLGRSALHSPLALDRPGFALDRLKYAFRPLPDADDVEMVRVKTLHLRYPGRLGRRELRFETLSSDDAGAIEDMLRIHAGGSLDDLQVSHAVLQLRLRLEGCSKTRFVRLWPDRCDAGQGPFRTRVLACLRGWGL